jgi:NADPH2:quinone reductase
MPAGYTYAQGACFNIGYTTAYHCLIERGKLQRGETCLIHGATGGMGLAAVHLAKVIGARVIATGGSDEKLAVVKAQGADCVINYNTDEKFAKAVKDATGGKGADVIFDPVGGAVFDQSISAAAWGGRILVVGFTSGVRPQAPANIVLIKGLSVLGCRAGEIIRRTPNGIKMVAEPRMKQLLEWANAGKLVPYVSHQFPLEQIGGAFKALLERQIIGRVVVNLELDQLVLPSTAKL